MAKKVSFDNLPKAVEKILEILTAEGSDHNALPELIQRIMVIEKRLDKFEQMLSPNRATMDKKAVLGVLNITPKILRKLEHSGLLLSHSEGRRTFYYEDDVVRCHMNQSALKAAVEATPQAVSIEPGSDKPEIVESESNHANDGLVDIEGAATMIGLSKLTVYKLKSTGNLPFVKQGRKLLFEVVALKKWMEDNLSGRRKRKAKRLDTVSQEPSTEGSERVDIHGASQILGRTPAAVRQHLSTIPHEKVGKKLYFDRKELEQWAETHRPRPRKSKPLSDETETA